MKFLDNYAVDFGLNVQQQPLGILIVQIKASYDVRNQGEPSLAWTGLVDFYNTLGSKKTKDQYSITSNLARNLPGALMQDWLVHLALALTKTRPQLHIFTEVRVPFGIYPVWEAGEVKLKSPSEKSDLAIGYMRDTHGQIVKNEAPWPSAEVTLLKPGYTVVPLITINSKIRVSQSEFFDWQGREQLMTKGNPHCLSLQVALRKEMDYSIVEAAQAGDKFFLLGSGGETNVVPDLEELARLLLVIDDHLNNRMS